MVDIQKCSGCSKVMTGERFQFGYKTCVQCRDRVKIFKSKPSRLGFRRCISCMCEYYESFFTDDLKTCNQCLEYRKKRRLDVGELPRVSVRGDIMCKRCQQYKHPELFKGGYLTCVDCRHTKYNLLEKRKDLAVNQYNEEILKDWYNNVSSEKNQIKTIDDLNRRKYRYCNRCHTIKKLREFRKRNKTCNTCLPQLKNRTIQKK